MASKILLFVVVCIGAIVGVLMCVYVVLSAVRRYTVFNTIRKIEKAEKKFNLLLVAHNNQFERATIGNRYVAYNYYKDGLLTKDEYTILLDYWLGNYDSITNK